MSDRDVLIVSDDHQFAATRIVASTPEDGRGFFYMARLDRAVAGTGFSYSI